MFFRDDLVLDLSFCVLSGLPLEFLREWDVVDEGPWVVEFVVPCPLEILHRLNELAKLLVADER